MATYKTWGFLGPLFGEQSQEDKLQEEAKKNRPTYKKNPAYEENVALANQAYRGRSPVFARKDQQIEQGAANDITGAQQVSSSTGDLLGLLSQINNSKQNALVNNAQGEGQFQQNALGTLMGAKVAGAEEDDKVWNQNILDPYNKDIQFKRDRLKADQEKQAKIMDTILSLGTTAAGFATGGFGFGGGGFMPRFRSNNGYGYGSTGGGGGNYPDENGLMTPPGYNG